MILECRPRDKMFRDPPGTDLITGEGLSAVEITIESFKRSGPFVHFGCADVDACFHSLRFREKICEYFCCEPMEAKWSGFMRRLKVRAFLQVAWCALLKYHSRWASARPPTLPSQCRANCSMNHCRPCVVNLSLIGLTRKCFPAEETQQFSMPTLTHWAL